MGKPESGAVIVIGHSHIQALMNASKSAGLSRTYSFVSLRDPRLRIGGLSVEEAHQRSGSPEGVNHDLLQEMIRSVQPAGAAVLSIQGNEHAAFTLGWNASRPAAKNRAELRASVSDSFGRWLDLLVPWLPPRLLCYPPSPPVDAATYGEGFDHAVVARLKDIAVAPPQARLDLWREQCRVIREICEARGVQFSMPPEHAFNEGGFLAPAFWSPEPNHANSAYGEALLRHIDAILAGESPASHALPPVVPTAAPARAHPYSDLPETSFWKQSVGSLPRSEVDPVIDPPFRIGRKDRVATAGSCFAQHISKRLRSAGFTFMVAEPGPSEARSAEGRGFHDFSARYGNVYTARQLLQLFDRAFGYFTPVERAWLRPDGAFCDPFRPRIEPDGFPTAAAVEMEARKHLRAVRRMFRQLDVLVFTLGLTESWASRLDGAVYPVAPGVVGGQYDPQKHAFQNFTAGEVISDLSAFIRKLRLVNRRAKMLLTVSPVPLVATATSQHVLAATTYSKSVLRVAAEEVSRANPGVFYFPSYEIITGPHALGGYFEDDRRSVRKEGVDHVMRVFMRHMTRDAEVTAEPDAMSVMEALCDEVVLERDAER